MSFFKHEYIPAALLRQRLPGGAPGGLHRPAGAHPPHAARAPGDPLRHRRMESASSSRTIPAYRSSSTRSRPPPACWAAHPAALHPARRSHLENALVDGVIELSDQLIGPGGARADGAQVPRQRLPPGRHEVRSPTMGGHSTAHGGAVQQAARAGARAARPHGFGLPPLDEMLGGDCPRAPPPRWWAPGTARRCWGSPSWWRGPVRASVAPTSVLRAAASPHREGREREHPLERYVKDGRIELVWQPPLEHFMDSLAEQLLEKLRLEEKTERRRLVIDGPRASARRRCTRTASPASCRPSQPAPHAGRDHRHHRRAAALQVRVGPAHPELANVVETVLVLRYWRCARRCTGCSPS